MMAVLMDTPLPDNLKKAVIENLETELRNLRVRQSGGGYQFTINLNPATGEFDIVLVSKIIKGKVAVK